MLLLLLVVLGALLRVRFVVLFVAGTVWLVLAIGIVVLLLLLRTVVLLLLGGIRMRLRRIVLRMVLLLLWLLRVRPVSVGRRVMQGGGRGGGGLLRHHVQGQRGDLHGNDGARRNVGRNNDLYGKAAGRLHEHFPARSELLVGDLNVQRHVSRWGMVVRKMVHAGMRLWSMRRGNLVGTPRLRLLQY